MHKFYYTYKITLLKGSLAGHYYLGLHRTNNLNDGYAGSGRILKDYYKKYDAIEGVTYVKSILQFYSSDEELNEAEKILIGNKYKTDKMCINLKQGGINIQHGGAKIGHKTTEETKNKISNSLKGRNVSIDTREKISNSLKGKKRGYTWNKGLPAWNKGLKTPEAVKEKQRKKHNLTNEQHNKIGEWAKSFIWINNGIEVKHINKNDFEKYKNLGYERGRKIA